MQVRDSVRDTRVHQIKFRSIQVGSLFSVCLKMDRFSFFNPSFSLPSGKFASHVRSFYPFFTGTSSGIFLWNKFKDLQSTRTRKPVSGIMMVVVLVLYGL